MVCGKEEHKHNWWCYDWYGELNCGKEEHEHTNDCYEYREEITITAKYQADISELWNDAVGVGTIYEGMSWKWDDSKSTGFQSTMPGENKKVSESNNNGTTRRELVYYVEDPNGTITYDGIKFSKYTTVVLMLSSGAYPTYNEEFFVIDGYDRHASTISQWYDGQMNGDDEGKWDSKGGGKFYYTRSEYELELVNGDRTETKKVDYLSDISQYLDQPNYNPLGDGTFDGWYLDPQFQSKYDGDYIMPKNLVLYAKWNPVTYEVNFVDSDNPSLTYNSQTVESKGLVEVVIPEKTGYVFKGWYIDKECKDAFDYATQITENKTLYAKWEANQYTTYTVQYLTSNGENVADPETHSGKVGSTVQAKAKKAEGNFETYTVNVASQTITLDPDSSNNVITFIYTKAENLTYKIQYVDEEGNVIFEEKEKTSDANYIKVTIGKDSLDEIYSMGYMPMQNFKWVNLTTGENIVTFVCTKATYSIKYELNGGNLETLNPETYTPADLEGNPIVLNNPTKTGYKFTGWEFTSENGKVVADDHKPLQVTIEYGSYGDLEFTATYVKDDTQTKDLSYTVEHIVDGEEEARVTKTGTATVWVNDPDTLTVNGDDIADQKFEGYKIGTIAPDVKAGSTVDNGTKITVTYVKDDTQTKDLSYTVEHIVDGEEEARVTKTGTATVWVNDPDTLTVNGDDIADQKFEGYKIGTIAPDVKAGSTVDNGTKITVTYVRDFETYPVTVKPYEGEYDGQEHNVTVNGTIEGDKVEYSLDGGQTYELGIAFGVADVTLRNNGVYNVTVRVTNGGVSHEYESTIKITPRPITITTGSASKTYDGTALTNSEVTITSGSLVNASDVTYAAVGSITNAGSTANTIEVGYANAQMDANYDVRVVEGTLTVYAQSIDPEDPHDPDPEDPEQPVYMGVDTNSPSNVVYDGAAHQWLPTVTAEDGTVLVLGTDYNVTYSTTDFTNVTGEIVVTITGAGNYAGEITRTYQITPRPVTLTSGSASKTYDGTALTNSEVTITSGSLVNASDVTYAAVGSITNAGSTANTIEVGYANAQMDANYDVRVVEGTLTVYAQSIDPEDPHDPDPEDPEQPVYMGVDTNSPSNVVYDGAAHQWLPTVTAEDGTVLVLGTDYNVTYSTTDFTNVTGEIVVTITGAGNYAGEITRTYQITPRPVTLTSGSASKTYDGTALTNSEVTITSGSLVNASDVTYAAVGSITNVGSSLNRISVSYASEQMARNYVVTLVEGTLTVNTAPTTPPTTPTTPPTTPGTPGTTTDDGATTDEPEVEEVEDEETPLSDGDVEDVEDNATPKGNNGIWALINLIAAIVTVILGLILLLSKRHRNDEEEDEEERQARIERGEEKEQEQKRGWICKVLGVIVAIASVVFFILTEDMSLPMALTDKWTIWMVVIAIVELVLVLVGRHWKDVDDEDQEQQA